MSSLSWKRLTVVVGALALIAAGTTRADLVTNGSFELDAAGNPNVIGQVNVQTTLQAWTIGPAQNGGDPGFDFVVDKNAATTGFPSQFSPPNIKVWAIKDSPDGGH